MIIVCNSCSAQYSVSDAKVRGKLVRITCKHCATAIVVDGRQMSDAEAASQKPVAGYALPRRDESVVATMPHSLAGRGPASSRTHSPVSSPVHSPVSAPMQSAMSTAMREEDQTMIARSRFGDDMSVHDERTVIGQIPKEALEFERMFAQRTQPPPPEPKGNMTTTAPPPGAPVPAAPPAPSFSSAPPEASSPSQPPESSGSPASVDSPASADSSTSSDSSAPSQPLAPSTPEGSRPPDSVDDETRVASNQISQSEPPTMGTKPNSDVRGLVSVAEPTHPSVQRAASARRTRVTLITLAVLAILIGWFVTQMPR